MRTCKRRKLDSLGKQTGESLGMDRTVRPSELDRSIPGAVSDSEGHMEPRLQEEPQLRTPATPESKYDPEGSFEDEDETETTGIDASQIAEIPFTINYMQPELKGRQKTKSQRLTDEGQQKAWPKKQKCLDNDEMVVHYEILPRTEWDTMKSYQTFIGEGGPCVQLRCFLTPKLTRRFSAQCTTKASKWVNTSISTIPGGKMAK